MKLILEKHHFDLGGHSYCYCPIYHVLDEWGGTDIVVLPDAAYYNQNGYRWKIKFTDESIKFLADWDKNEVIPELPYTLITEGPEKSLSYEE